MPERDRTRELLDDLIEDLKKLRDDYVMVVDIGYTQRRLRDSASDRQSRGSHSDTTGAAVVDMAECRRQAKIFEKKLRAAIFPFQDALTPAYNALHRAFKAADPRRDERVDNRIRA